MGTRYACDSAFPSFQTSRMIGAFLLPLFREWNWRFDVIGGNNSNTPARTHPLSTRQRLLSEAATTTTTTTSCGTRSDTAWLSLNRHFRKSFVK
eukprot:7418036-Pyramimonas_sp.AAC.2